MFVIKVDDEGSTKMAKHDARRNRTNHIGIKYPILRNLYIRNEFEFGYCPITEIMADILKGPHGRSLFEELGMKIRLHRNRNMQPSH